MACTIDHLRVDHRLEIISDFTDARGVRHRAGESGVLRRMELDWPRQEIEIEWEREDAREKMFFSLAAKQGPRNGAMRVISPSTCSGSGPAAFEVMSRALRSDDALWQGVGYAMARDSQPGDQHPVEVIIEVLQGSRPHCQLRAVRSVARSDR